MGVALITVVLEQEHDAVLARQRTLQIGGLLGMGLQDQTRMATAVSELARNVLRYTPGGRVEYILDDDREPMFCARVSDTGKGIAHIKTIMGGCYVSPSGMGIGIIGTSRMVDHFELQTGEQGTVFTIGKRFPRPAVAMQKLAGEVTAKLAHGSQMGLMDAFERQNQELLVTLSEVLARQADIERINQELAETNRGVVALYAELDQKNKELREMSELKSRFLSAISHELRTPLSSIRGLTRLLLDRIDGELTEEQNRQVTYIRSTADSLTEMVNDLLDLAKIEAGKVQMKQEEFEISELFSGLRGMFRPLLEDKPINLSFSAGPGVGKMWGDEGKVTQVLRNLISNAVKFTHEGEIAVTADMEESCVRFDVRDTGIGICENDQKRLFEDYMQVDSPLQRKLKGTGLGLSLSREFAELLGGELTVSSAPGVGSVFTLRVSLIYTCPPISDPKSVPGDVPRVETPSA
jgi:signal transduction histidine kinase